MTLHGKLKKRKAGDKMEFEKSSHRIFKEEKGHILAEITYVQTEDNKVIANHTYVDPSLRGQGVAEELVDALVDEMKKEGKKIVPLCPYVVTLFERKPEKYKDIAST